MTPSFKFAEKGLGDIKADLHVALIWQEAPLVASAKALDTLATGALGKLIKAGTFKGTEGETFLYPLPGGKSGFVLMLGLGKQSEAKLNTVRCAGGHIVQAAAKGHFKTAAISPADFAYSGASDQDDLTLFCQALTEGITMRDYEFEDLKKTRDTIWHMSEVTYALAKGGKKAAESGVARGIILGESANFSRSLVNNPPNVKTPTYLADRAKEIADLSSGSTKAKILNRKDCERLGMGSFLGVAQGSDTEPKFIVLEYSAGLKGAPTVCLVGKAITFDTGGISLKPAQGMESMKYDMAGGAGVLGAMRALSLLKPDVNVVGIVPATDNMPSGKAIHPSDVIKSSSGISIEIISTDAEGRLILADGLEYAQRYNPDACVDMATLTGACVIALGTVNAAIMCNNSNLTKQLIRAGKVANERLWELPLDKEYYEQIKSPVADLKNSGGREAGSITAGAFLSKFVGDMAWAHLDIAGVAWEDKGRPYIDKGATGFGVRLLTEFVMDFQRPVKE